MRKFGFFVFALLSLVVHVTAANLLLTGKQEIEIERGVGSAALEVGSLFDSVQSEAVEPEEVKQTETVPREIKPTELRQAIAVKEFVETEVKRAEVAAIKPDEIVAPLVRDLTVNEKLKEPDILKPLAIAPIKVKAVQEAKPVKALPVKKPQKVEAVKPQPAKKVTLKKPQKPKKKVTKKKVTKKKKAKTAQRASNASRKGAKKANAKGKKKATGGSGGKNTKANGKALLSNYRGKVTSRVDRRAQRLYGRLSRKVTGAPRVAFTVSRSGSLTSGPRLVRSSGNKKLDNAALRAVRRAAPFPKMPQGIGRSSITFSVIIKKRR